jgi:hypothetical protein
MTTNYYTSYSISGITNGTYYLYSVVGYGGVYGTYTNGPEQAVITTNTNFDIDFTPIL